jgi:hypothetical protein
MKQSALRLLKVKLDTGWKCMINFTFLPLYPDKTPVHNEQEAVWAPEKTNLLPLPGFELWIV